MSIWFFIWLLLSGTLLYFLIWTVFILYRQKKSWRAFATKNKLRYKTKSLLSSPEMNGEMDGYTVSLFTGEHLSEDVRRSRKLTAVEIALSTQAPITGGVASGEMVAVLKSLSGNYEYRPKHSGWHKDYIAISDDLNVLKGYLNSDRVDALMKLMKIKNAWVILVFKDDVSLLRFDTPNPLDSIEKLNKILKTMISCAKVLELQSGEGENLKKRIVKDRTVPVSLDVSDQEIENTGLELEENPDDN